MERLEINDLIMGAYFDSMRKYVPKEQIDKGKAIYERQRLEVEMEEMGNEDYESGIV